MEMRERGVENAVNHQFQWGEGKDCIIICRRGRGNGRNIYDKGSHPPLPLRGKRKEDMGKGALICALTCDYKISGLFKTAPKNFTK